MFAFGSTPSPSPEARLASAERRSLLPGPSVSGGLPVSALIRVTASSLLRAGTKAALAGRTLSKQLELRRVALARDVRLGAEQHSVQTLEGDGLPSRPACLVPGDVLVTADLGRKFRFGCGGVNG